MRLSLDLLARLLLAFIHRERGYLRPHGFEPKTREGFMLYVCHAVERRQLGSFVSKVMDEQTGTVGKSEVWREPEARPKCLLLNSGIHK